MKRTLFIGAMLVALLMAMVSPVAAGEGGDDYTVKLGDTLSGIALAFNVTLDTLGEINGISNLDLIFAGETLILNGPVPTVYEVRYGDTLGLIAARYNTTVSDLLSLNPDITNANIILLGQEISLPADAGSD